MTIQNTIVAWRVAMLTKSGAWDRWIKACDTVLNNETVSNYQAKADAYRARGEAEKAERLAWRDYREALAAKD